MSTLPKHSLPIGAVVIYNGAQETEQEGDRAKLVIVAHSRDTDGEPLYMAAKRSIMPPGEEYKLFSKGYLSYALMAGWFVGNAGETCFVDTGERVKVKRFDVERYCSGPQE